MSNVVTFIHMNTFNNSEAQRPFEEEQFHCWAVRNEDVAAFCEMYSENHPVMVSPVQWSTVTAYNYKEVDRYVCAGYQQRYPQGVVFDVATHCINAYEEFQRCYCDDAECSGGYDVTVFDNPFQVVIATEKAIAPRW